MSLAAIKALPVQAIAARDAILWLWTPNCLLPDALDVVRCWGFRFVSTAVWVKPHSAPSPGSVSPRHETLIIAKRGAGLPFEGTPMPSAYTGSVGRSHSRKPQHFLRELERLYPSAGKLDLFGRQPHPNWVVLGNQVGQVAVPGATVAANDTAEGADAKHVQTGEAH